MIIDSHTHLLPERLAAAIRRFFEQHIAADLAYPYQAELAREHILAAGIQRCWSLPYAHRPGMASTLNQWMADTFSSDPLVIPGATVHPQDDVTRVLDEALGELRLRLLKLHCSVGAYTVDDPRLAPLWKRVSEEGQPVVIHAGRAVAGTTAAPDLTSLARVAEQWPDARIIIAHCGGPAVAPALELLRKTRAVHADLTPVVRHVLPLTAQDIAGLERRLLFGSDAPNTVVTIEQALHHIRSWGLPPEDEAAILGGNAQRLLA